MANKFTEMAHAALGGSPIINGRTKISTEDVIRDYPSGVTIIDFDVIEKADGSYYPVFAIAEDEGVYFNGGTIAAKVVNEWLDNYDGNLDMCTKDLREAGGVKFKLGKGKTKQGKSITTFDPVEK